MKNWYIVQSYSSFEKKVADAIKKEAIISKLADMIEEDVTDVTILNYIKRLGLTFKKTPKFTQKETRS